MDVTPPRPPWLLARSCLFLAANLLLGQFLYDRALRLTENQDRLWLGDGGAWLAYLAAQLLAGAWLVAGASARQPFAAVRHRTGSLTAWGIAAASVFPLGHLLAAWRGRSFASDQFPGMSGSVLGASGLGRAAGLYRAANTLLAPTQFAAAVAALWVALLASGLWRRPSGPLDWTGVAIGGAYLALYAADYWSSWLT